MRGGFEVPRLALVVGWLLAVDGAGLVWVAATRLSWWTGVVSAVTGVAVLARGTRRRPAAALPASMNER